MERSFTRVFLPAALSIAVLCGMPAFAATCESLSGLTIANTTITVAKAIPAGSFKSEGAGQAIGNLPAFCEVHGILKPTPVSVIHFEVWMPVTNWNNKLQVVGNGGLAGTISYPAMATALRNNFATASTDTGHTATEPKEWLENRDRLIDYSYRGLHLTTVDAKALVDAFYTQNAKESIYTGCSTGGKQGLMEAQRFPADFDGIVAGDAANYWTHQIQNELWDGIITGTPESSLPAAKLQLIQDAVLQQCDALDGVKDGLIADHRRCSFDPKKLLCKGPDTSACLTAAQESAVEKMYTGPVNPRTGTKIYAGFYPGNEVGWGGNGRPAVINRTDNSSGVSSFDFTRFALLAKPDWAFRTFDFDKDVQAMDEKLAAVSNATDPNLDEFRKLGHKLFYYHGAADPLIPAQNGIDYYESVVAMQGKGGKNGMAETQTFFRAFLVPGLYHCAGGPGPSAFGTSGAAPVMDSDHDAVSAVTKWVETGAAPDKIIATKYVENKPEKGIAMQRPLCAWPMAARYKGTGDTNDASNFSCVK
jgi:feruloyl esterase